jgi:hypothetical protein
MTASDASNSVRIPAVPRRARWGRPAAAALLIAAAGSGMAADPNVLSTVNSVPSIVTYSRPLQSPPFVTYVAYEVSIVNYTPIR